jgi:hypothetical protein
MARLARVIASGLPYPVTQRGNRRQTTFFAPDDYRALLEAGLSDEALDDLRRHESTGRPSAPRCSFRLSVVFSGATSPFTCRVSGLEEEEIGTVSQYCSARFLMGLFGCL